MKIVRTRYTIAEPSCVPFLDPNTQDSIMCVRACTNFTDPLPSISPTSPTLTGTEMLGSCRSICIPVYREMDQYHFYNHGLIVKQRRHRNNPKHDRMLTSREPSTNVQTHDECNINTYTAYYPLPCGPEPNVVVASDEKRHLPFSRRDEAMYMPFEETNE